MKRMRWVHVWSGVVIGLLLVAVAFWLLAQPGVAGPSDRAAKPHVPVQVQAQTTWGETLRASVPQAPDLTPTATPYPPSDNCVTCHTDKAKLKELAEEPQKVKSEKAAGEG